MEVSKLLCTCPVENEDCNYPVSWRRLVFKPPMRFLAVDLIHGHVLVLDQSGFRGFIPYVHLISCCQEVMEHRVHFEKGIRQLIAAGRGGIPQIPLVSIVQFHDIIPLFYWPQLYDGTEGGQYERIVYRLKAKGVLGVTTLDLIYEG